MRDQAAHQPTSANHDNPAAAGAPEWVLASKYEEMTGVTRETVKQRKKSGTWKIGQKWSMPIRDWKAALTRFTIQFGDRISVN